MDQLFVMQRNEQQAAMVIQRCYRRFERLCFWYSYLEGSKAAVVIQVSCDTDVYYVL